MLWSFGPDSPRFKLDSQEAALMALGIIFPSSLSLSFPLNKSTVPLPVLFTLNLRLPCSRRLLKLSWENVARSQDSRQQRPRRTHFALAHMFASPAHSPAGHPDRNRASSPFPRLLRARDGAARFLRPSRLYGKGSLFSGSCSSFRISREPIPNRNSRTIKIWLKSLKTNEKTIF